MKIDYLWFTAVAAVTIFCLIGCKKDKQQPFVGAADQPDSSKIYLPIKISGSNVTTSYSYLDTSGIIWQFTKKSSNSDTSCTISYSSYLPESLYFSVNGVGVSQTQYTLNANGQVIRGDVFGVEPAKMGDWDYYEPTTLMSYYTLTYNTSGQLSHVSYYHTDGQKDHDLLFEYTAEGNISGMHSSGDMNLEYDNFNGIGKSVKNAHLFYIEGRDQLLFYTRNNPVKLNAASRTYKYNLDKYPVEMAYKQPDGTSAFKIQYRLK
jgi:hypothetical protein